MKSQDHSLIDNSHWSQLVIAPCITQTPGKDLRVKPEDDEGKLILLQQVNGSRVKPEDDEGKFILLLQVNSSRVKPEDDERNGTDTSMPYAV